MRESGCTVTTVRRCLIAAAALVPLAALAMAGAPVPRTVVDLQPAAETGAVSVRSAAGRTGRAMLVNLNPTIGAWYLLTVAWDDGAGRRTTHIEDPWPRSRTVVLDSQFPTGIVVVEGTARYRCELFGPDGDALERAAAGAIFEPICGGRLYVRNHARGRHTAAETAADFLREHVWGGETLLGLGHQIMGDRNRETGTVGAEAARLGRGARDGPLPALVDHAASDRTIVPDNLGIDVAKGAEGLTPGVWYAATGSPGVFVSVVQPGMVAKSILHDGDRAVNALDGVEASALAYLIAFDLDRFELGYAGGTEHPDVGWSAHMLARMRDPALPGPDGIDTIPPLIATGMVNPVDARRIAAAFTGGFKRAHGAFLWGELSTRNRGSHYGFIENGTILSTLQPGLATIVMFAGGDVEMKTWTEEDKARLAQIRHARQNGVALIEFDRSRRTGVPGRLVNQWGPGNWSGSQDMRLRTIRAAAAIQQTESRRFFIYSVFSAATPSAMARVLQAYQCRYAMMLDMNALEHTYLALHKRAGSSLSLEHLIKGMEALDQSARGAVVPRFVGYPDNRDFFYVMRRDEDDR